MSRAPAARARSDEVAVDLRAHIVHVGFDHRDRRVPVLACFGRFVFADQDA